MTPSCPPALILASASPRRREILAALGVAFRAEATNVDEVAYADDVRATVAVNAARKLAWCRQRWPAEAVIAADTAIDFDGGLVAKPASRADAADMLRRFAGRAHTVLTASAVWSAATGGALDVDASTVWIRPLTAREIDAYMDRVPPLDKAGGYDLDLEGGRIVLHCEGSPTNVRGLPVERIGPWLARAGLMPPSRHHDNRLIDHE